MLIDGLACTQAVDSSGESIVVRGIDVGALQSSDGIPLNLEHAQNAVPLGEVIYAHKILSDADVENDRQRHYWDLVRHIPCIYVVCRLYDAAGNPEAVRIAASIRDRHARGLPVYCRFSVEGSTLSRDPSDANVITESVWRKLACTFAPCNKSALAGLLADPNPPDGFPVISKSDPDSTYIGGACIVVGDPLLPDPDIQLVADEIADAILKALEAGGYDAAPSALTGGSALQHEPDRDAHRVRDILKDYGVARAFSKDEFKAFAKHRLPDASPEFLDHYADIADDIRLGKAEPLDLADSAAADQLSAATNAAHRRLAELRSTLADPAPQVFRVSAAVAGSPRHVGRFMVDDGVVHHLEDNYGLLPVPEGPLSAYDAGRVAAWAPLFGSADVAVHAAGDADPSAPENPGNGGPPEPAEPPVDVRPDPPRPSRAFHYFRAGHSSPHLVEFTDAGAAMDGAALTPEETALVLRNAQDGLATLRYALKSGGGPDDIQKADMDVSDALRHVRSAVAAGTMHSDVERALTAHVYTDPMTGMGNRYGYHQFVDQDRPGVYIGGDLNDLKHLNDTHGHDAGDAGIRAMARAFKTASEKVGTIKSWRTGGDESVHYAPTFQDAAAFVRHAHAALQQEPPINGTHRVSASFGFGSDVPTADRALYAAKAQKVDPVTSGRRWPAGHVPDLAHSLVAGAEGPIPLHAAIPSVPKAA